MGKVPWIIVAVLTALAGIYLPRINSITGPPIAVTSNSIQVNRPLQEVWDVAIDFAGWEEWCNWEVMRGFNVPSGDGAVVEPDQSGSMKLALAGPGKFLPFRLPVTLNYVDHSRHSFQWGGSIPYLLHIEHRWTLTRVSETVTRVDDVERFWRIFGYLKLATRDDGVLNRGMLHDLKARLESFS